MRRARAGLVVVLLPSLFTNSPEVIGVMNSMLPLMCVGLTVHTASMATEGMLLAGAALAPPACGVARCVWVSPAADSALQARHKNRAATQPRPCCRQQTHATGLVA